MTRGHRDSLDLRCRTLPFPSSCRLSGAFRKPGDSGLLASAQWAEGRPCTAGPRHRHGPAFTRAGRLADSSDLMPGADEPLLVAREVAIETSSAPGVQR